MPRPRRSASSTSTSSASTPCATIGRIIASKVEPRTQSRDSGLFAEYKDHFPEQNVLVRKHIDPVREHVRPFPECLDLFNRVGLRPPRFDLRGLASPVRFKEWDLLFPGEVDLSSHWGLLLRELDELFSGHVLL
jgi:hypothetical protein